MNKAVFKIGDKVSVIEDTIKGYIVSIDRDILNIEDENGFIYKYTKKEVVLINDVIFDNIKVKIKDKTLVREKKSVIKIKKETILEVDLHIHNITRSNRYMSNTDMLLTQINVARTKINSAIKNKISKIIFIHGNGQGVLKSELLNLLKNYPVEINDADYKKYGRGAMEVKIFLSKI